MQKINSELEYAQEELLKQRQFAEEVINTAPVIILVLDTKGRVVSFNPYMEQLSGHRLQEARGKDWFEFFLPKGTRSSTRESFLKTIGIVQSKIHIDAIIAKNGCKLDIEWRYKTLKNLDNHTFGLLCIGQDITERKKAMEIVENHKSALERKSIALREVIEQIEFEKNKVKDDVRDNVNALIHPIIKKLRTKGVNQKYLDLLTDKLLALTSSFSRTLTAIMLKLSSKEIEVCNLLVGGLCSKEIADFLNISYQTVEKHRKVIRRKLGIGRKKINLTTYLQMIQKAKA